MRIAQVSPLFESVPPEGYGGTERIVSYLTEELVAQGHDVTLFATSDSQTSARLVGCAPRAMRLDEENCFDPYLAHFAMLEEVLSRLDEFDIVHWHIDYLHYPASSRIDYRHLTTLHGRLDIPELKPLYRYYPNIPVVSISNHQRLPLPEANWLDTVYHGLPLGLLKPVYEPGEYLCFIGRMSPEKGVVEAIEFARRVGMPLKLAAKIDATEVEYFESVVRPKLADPLVEYIGEIDNDGKQQLVGNALAMVFPIQWPEPFGLVMIESMACGTPVIAIANGSVPEVLTDGESGLLAEDLDEAVRVFPRIHQVSRKRCRALFEERFSAHRMAAEYVGLYKRILAGSQAVSEKWSKKRSLLASGTQPA